LVAMTDSSIGLVLPTRRLFGRLLKSP